MVSKSFCISVLLIAFSVAERGFAFRTRRSDEISSIPLSELLSEFHREGGSGVSNQLIVMFWAASYGERLYNLAVNVSTDCQRTIKANWMLMGKLVVCEEAFQAMKASVFKATKELNELKELNEHPLEMVCKNLEKWYPGMTNLSSTFEKAKQDAASFVYTSRRPPYYSKLKTPEESVMVKLIEMSGVPELAKLDALYSFVDLLGHVPGNGTKRSYLFAKSCQAVAKEGQFEDKLQANYETAISYALPHIMVEDKEQRYANFLKYEREKGLWWVPEMLRKFYSEISKDPNVKKSVDDMAAIIGKDASKEDLDFSKLPTFHEVFD